MNGPHDLGGKHGLGPVNPEHEEPVFHFPWEGRMYGIAFATIANGCLTIDEKRHHIEKMPHAMYVDSSYYEHWLYSIEGILDEKRIVASHDIDRRVAEQAPETMPAHPAAPTGLGELAQRMVGIIHGGTPHDAEWAQGAKFRTGDRIRTANPNPRTHIRIPGYAKDKVGVVQRHHGAFGNPEYKAHPGREVDPVTHLYQVSFAATDLWGPDAEKAADVVSLDLCEQYLQPA